MSGRAQGDAQDQAAGGRSEANQPGAETFFLPNGSSPTLISQRSDATAKTVESKPMSTAAVIEELGHGLERIQQQGQQPR